MAEIMTVREIAKYLKMKEVTIYRCAQEGRLPGIKIIMMTAYPTVDSRIVAFQKGALAYFTKPVNMQKLLDTIRGL